VTITASQRSLLKPFQLNYNTPNFTGLVETPANQTRSLESMSTT
jgi:hypothetical protein